MDFENDLIDEKGKFAAFGIVNHAKEQNAIENTKRLLKKARDSRIKVIYVKVEYSKDFNEVKNAKAPLYMGTPGMNGLVKGTGEAR